MGRWLVYDKEIARRWLAWVWSTQAGEGEKKRRRIHFAGALGVRGALLLLWVGGGRRSPPQRVVEPTRIERATSRVRIL
jgi:hypothetical protein